MMSEIEVIVNSLDENALKTLKLDLPTGWVDITKYLPVQRYEDWSHNQLTNFKFKCADGQIRIIGIDLFAYDWYKTEGIKLGVTHWWNE